MHERGGRSWHGEGAGTEWSGDDFFVNLALAALGAIDGLVVVTYLATWASA